jgi:hypothetical protein
MKASQDGTHVTGDKTRMENELTRDGDGHAETIWGLFRPVQQVAYHSAHQPALVNTTVHYV